MKDEILPELLEIGEGHRLYDSHVSQLLCNVVLAAQQQLRTTVSLEILF